MKNVRMSRKRLPIIVLTVVALMLFGMAGAALASSGGGEHGGGHGGEGAQGAHWMNTDTYKVFNFIVLVAALVFLLKKPLSEALNSRITGIKEQLEELEQKKAAAEADLASYNEKLATLEAEAEQIIAEYIKQGEEAKGRILKEAEESAQKLEAQAKKNVEHAFKQARKELQEEVFVAALEKAEQALKDKITDEDQDKLVDEYIQKVVA